MVEDLERVEERLDNIRSVQPLLEALRTIAMGSWQTARRHQRSVSRFQDRLKGMLILLLPHLSARKDEQPAEGSVARRSVVLAIGSERGLCGQFNRVMAQQAQHYLDRRRGPDSQVELWALGTRLVRLLRRYAVPLHWSERLSVTGLPPYRLAFDLARRWLVEYEQGELDRIDILYNDYRGVGRYQSTIARLVPPEITVEAAPGAEALWPQPIVETDPQGLYVRIVEQLTSVGLYQLFVASAVAEHSTRYQLMEDASQNAERLTGELTMAVLQARRQAITQEMQELVVGAGMLRT
jgi:F-type H+-transporting ATPase subunit gamma